MFQKRIEDNLHEYIIVSPKEEIFMSVVIDDEKFVTQTNLAIIDLNDKEAIYHNQKTIDVKVFERTIGLYTALNEIVLYMTRNKEDKGYLSEDIQSICYHVFNDLKYLKEESKKLADTNSFLFSSGGMKRWTKEYIK